jgi:long-subunit acyl-CoA synthetase (AMP-forming)
VSHYITNADDVIVPIGKPIQNIRLYVLDAAMKPVAEGIWGEIAIAGVGLAKGYLNKEDLTRQKFVTLAIQEVKQERIYRTGDIGRWLSDGSIEFKGRKDNQVKLRGQRIELAEVESTLLKHDLVKAAAVTLKEEARKELCIVAYVVAVGDELNALSLRGFLSQSLPGYMVPAFVVFMQELPVTINGKLDYKALPELEINATLATTFEAPASELEKQISAVWQEILGGTNIGVDHNFFDVGGTSLRLILVYQKLLILFPELKMTDLFKYTTIRSLSAFLGAEVEVVKVEGIEV